MTQNYIERYWRDATPEDAIKEPPMVARFRTDDPGPVKYVIDKLIGVIRTNAWKWRTATGGYLHCQVYDAPDAGEGWRLVDVDSENLLTGDEVWTEGGKWEPIQTIQCYGRRCVIRRRITPAVTYVPFTWEDREQLRGRWVYRIHANGTRDERMLGYAQQAANGDIEFGGFLPDTLVREWKFLDTGKPVGKEVAQ